MTTLAFWKEYVETNGKPCVIYLDMFSTYKNNQKKNTVNVLELTQFQRACRQLGVEVINAHSPQAKGRIERLFQTLQDRLVKELRLKNISSITEANKFLVEVFIPWFNKKFAVVPKKETNLHTLVTTKELSQLSSVLSVQDQRSIMHDGKLYQVIPKQHALVRIGDLITVQTRLDGQIVIVKQDTELLFKEILERSKKVVEVKTEDSRRFGNKPKAGHPWNFKQQTALSLNPVLAQG